MTGDPLSSSELNTLIPSATKDTGMMDRTFVSLPQNSYAEALAPNVMGV